MFDIFGISYLPVLTKVDKVCVVVVSCVQLLWYTLTNCAWAGGCRS